MQLDGVCCTLLMLAFSSKLRFSSLEGVKITERVQNEVHCISNSLYGCC